MAKVYAMIANGSEEVECLAVVDVLKRCGIEVSLVSAHEEREIVSSHGIRIQADEIASKAAFSDGDAIFLPGGIPGSEHLYNCAPLREALKKAHAEGRRIAAICAAPAVVLGRLGYLQGRRATCYPGFEKDLLGAEYTGEGVITDGNITTARGLGYALDLGLELGGLLVGRDVAAKVKSQIQYDQV
ncbi:MAG: DJ-1/PfpI family protein [Clostridiales bacterium]|nr:DJ-1/PfpI family protein [Clostridiales bacterium]